MTDDVKSKEGGRRRRDRQAAEARAILEKVDRFQVKEVIQVGLADWAEGPTLLELFSHSRFMAIEPVARYIDNAVEDGFPGNIYQRVAWDEDGLCFTLGDRGSKTSIFVSKGRRGREPIHASSMTLDMLEAGETPPEFEAALLWMDCEGAERHVLRGAPNLMPKIKWIVAEHREIVPVAGWASSTDLIRDLEGLGFRQVDQVEMDGLFVRE